MDRLVAAMRRHADRLPFNLLDPLTEEPLRAASVVSLQDEQGRRQLYDGPTLARALWGCGKFADPFTRRPLEPEELRRIDETAAAAGRLVPSLLLEHDQPCLLPGQADDRDTMANLERQLAEAVEEVTNDVDHHRCTCGWLRRTLFEACSEIARLLLMMAAMDPDAAIAHYERFRTSIAHYPPMLLREIDVGLMPFIK